MSDKRRIEVEDMDASEKATEEETALEEGDAEAENMEITLTDEELLTLCKERVCVGCDQKGEADEHRLRTLAEMDNFKKRLHREQEEFRRYAAEGVLSDLLPVLDNLELALQHGKMVEACKDVVMGVDMTRKVFLDTLKQHGLEPVGQVGEAFNPELHEAVGEEQRDDMAPGHVATLMQAGYVLNERLIRPAKVAVSK